MSALNLDAINNGVSALSAATSAAREASVGPAIGIAMGVAFGAVGLMLGVMYLHQRRMTASSPSDAVCGKYDLTSSYNHREP